MFQLPLLFGPLPVFLLDTLVRGIEGTKKVLNAIFDNPLLRLGLVVDLAIFVAKSDAAQHS